MTSFHELPTLPTHVEYLGSPDQPFTEKPDEEDAGLRVLRAYYRVHGLTVAIGWVVGHDMGSFREPNQLRISFDEHDFGTADDNGPGSERASAFNGITTSVLRSIPMAHARALMRDRHEHLSVAKLRDEIMPLPSRVETDEDYVHVATAYVALGSTSVEPIKRLAEWTQESVDTWSARLRRARAKGILQGKGRNAGIAPEYESASNQIRSQMRARKAGTRGDQ